ncbi:Cof-type HAD-IIB family hydrolase [Lactovum odontotermitis]
MIKAIAVDMDGTFLDSENNYNRERFGSLFQAMKHKGIRFIVASGNQYAQLRSFFPENYQEITFASENGANLLRGDLPFWHAKISSAVVEETLELLETRILPEHYLVCGEKSAYISDNVSDEVFSFASYYYPQIKRLHNIRQALDEKDDLFKFALNFKEAEATEKLSQLIERLQGKLQPVSSGHGDIDLILPGVNKFTGLSRLGEKLGFTKDEIMAFGDSGNDFEMIQQVKYGVAMGNAQPELKAAAWRVIGPNNTEALLDMIELVVNGQID